MKHLTLLLIALQLLSSAYAQQNFKQKETWITDNATITFKNNKIYYTYVQSPSLVRLQPTYMILDTYISQIDLNRHFTNKSQKQTLTDLNTFIDNFEIEENDNYNKDYFIRSATLKIIWASYNSAQFTESSYLKLLGLKNDKNDDTANKAKLAIALFEKLSSSKNLKFNYSKNDDD